MVSACNTATNTDKEIITEQNTNKDSVAAAIDDSAATSKKKDTIDMSLNCAWTDGSSENAVFSVDGRKIFFVEHFTTEKLFMNGDTAVAYYDDDSLGNSSYRLYKIHSDTLIYDDGGQRKKYWKFNG